MEILLASQLIPFNNSLSYEGPVDTTDPNVILSKGQDRTVFTSDQFKSFEKAIADSVDYQVWQQNHKK